MKGYKVAIMELDVPDHPLYSLPEKLLDHKFVTEGLEMESKFVEPMVRCQFPLGGTDLFGASLAPGSPAERATSRALTFVQSASRSSYFLDDHGVFCPTVWALHELPYIWWHREAPLWRHLLLDGSVKARWVPSLVPLESEIPLYMSWFEHGVLPAGALL